MAPTQAIAFDVISKRRMLRSCTQRNFSYYTLSLQLNSSEIIERSNHRSRTTPFIDDDVNDNRILYLHRLQYYTAVLGSREGLCSAGCGSLYFVSLFRSLLVSAGSNGDSHPLHYIIMSHLSRIHLMVCR